MSTSGRRRRISARTVRPPSPEFKTSARGARFAKAASSANRSTPRRALPADRRRPPYAEVIGAAKPCQLTGPAPMDQRESHHDSRAKPHSTGHVVVGRFPQRRTARSSARTDGADRRRAPGAGARPRRCGRSPFGGPARNFGLLRGMAAGGRAGRAGDSCRGGGRAAAEAGEAQDRPKPPPMPDDERPATDAPSAATQEKANREYPTKKLRRRRPRPSPGKIRARQSSRTPRPPPKSRKPRRRPRSRRRSRPRTPMSLPL